jgi:hypothetical protein
LCAFCCVGQGCTSQEIRFGLWKRGPHLSGNAQKAVNAPSFLDSLPILSQRKLKLREAL